MHGVHFSHRSKRCLTLRKQIFFCLTAIVQFCGDRGAGLYIVLQLS